MDWFDVVFLENIGFVVYELWNDYHGCVVLARVLAFFCAGFFDCNFRFSSPFLAVQAGCIYRGEPWPPRV